MESKHYGKLVECDCGAKMRRTSIARHKKNSCSLNRSLQLSSKTIRKRRTDVNKNDSKSPSPPILLNESTVNGTAQLISIEQRQITLTIKRFSNGNVLYEHDEIDLGNVSIVSSASSLNEIGPGGLELYQFVPMDETNEWMAEDEIQ